MKKGEKLEAPKGYITINDFARLLKVERRTVYNILLRTSIARKRENNNTFIHKKAALEFKKKYA